ncbi:hypothetical protein DRI50_12155 [candidate division KSB1 bacterium]|jgi:hypothetical protein|nr:MAG: hypothetical protein DRI50_12155 [candidate division KSB1 bacterium]
MKSNRQKEDNTLYEEIAKFRKRRIWWAIALVLISTTGIIIPIVPGTLLLLFALALIRPGIMEKLRRYFGLKKS